MNFTDTAQLYRDAGWAAALPLPRARKSPPPKGSTGHDGVDLSWPDIVAWGEDIGDDPFNFALRMPATVIGIDVDCYNGKRGAETIADAENRWGGLPATFWSTSRTDGSGIQYFRVPEDAQIRGELGPGVEVVQRTHRYSVVWPSIHPDTRDTYKWVHPHGLWADDIPRVDELPNLPEAWLTGLSVSETTALCGDIDTSGMTFCSNGTMSATVKERLNQALADLRGGGSRHDSTRDHVLRLMSMSANGESGVRAALTSLRREFVAVVGAERPDADSEFDRMLSNERGRQLVAANKSGTSPLWDATPWLQHIRDTAYSRMLSPAIVLNAMIAYRLGEVPPSVMLPASVGSEGSLNFYAVLYGKSGLGKTTALRVAKELIGSTHYTAPPGSGEKIPGLFVRHEPDSPDGLRRVADRAVVAYDEITSLGGMAKRSGSTLTGMLASAWSGAALGAQHQDATRTHPVPEQSYRLCMTIGVQPRNVGILMDHIGTGLPQRFVWTNALAPELVDREIDIDADDRPITPLPLGTLIYPQPGVASAPAETVPVCLDARREVRRASALKHDENAPEVDSHRLLLQLKVAAGLSLLRPDAIEPVVDDDSWRLARMVLEQLHDPVLAKAYSEARRMAETKATVDGQLDAKRQHASEMALGEKAAKRMLTKMTDAGMTWREVERCYSHAEKPKARMALDYLVDSGTWVEVDGRYFNAAAVAA